MTGYVRVDTSNNIADGNIISASDLDNEFDGIQAAFNVSTGHNHDGTTGEGAPILVLGPAQDVVVGASTVTPKTTNTVDIGSSSLKFKDLWLSGNTNIAGTTTLGGALTYGGVTLSNAVTGIGNMVLSISPTLVTPALGTPSSATLTNATGLPIATGVSGLGTGVATFLATPSSANLAAAVSDETGTGALVFANSPTLVTPALGTPSALVGTNITGTAANFNINGTVGATTPASGSFTTLATSGAVTHNAGTANGVAYLNGSKVLTTGSALTFDGASLSNTRASGSFATSSFITNIGSITGAFSGDSTLGLVSVGSYSNHPVAFYQNNAEQMRLTSTGLGIGTSSPAARLSVITASANSTAATIGGIEYGGSKRGLSIKTFQSAGGDDCGVEFNAADGLAGYGAFKFSAHTTTLATLDASGNLGLGVTPSAWDTATPALQIKERLSLSGYLGNSYVTHNAYLAPSGWKYQTSNAVSQFRFADGSFIWNTAPSGTAGNAISFTQAMSLLANGNLLLGTTTDEGRLTVAEASAGVGVSFLSSSGNYAGRIGTTNEAGLSNGLDIHATRGDGKIVFKVNSSERARITSGGDFGIGTTSPDIFARGYTRSLGVTSSGSTSIAVNGTSGGYLDVGFNGTRYGQIASLSANDFSISGIGASTYISFLTNFNERARITSGGALLVGTTSVTGAGASVGQIVSNFDGAVQNGMYVSDTRTSAGTDNAINFGRGATLVGRLDTTLTSLTLTNLSDQRVKTNVQDSAGALVLVDSVKVRQFDWTIDNSHEDFGFVAQELNEVLPQAVSVGKTEEEMWGVNFVKLVPILTKAIQEQQTIITALTARVAALESN